jgi:hypothetical protein
MELSVPAEDIVARYGVPGPDDLMLLVMGPPSHGGSG